MKRALKPADGAVLLTAYYDSQFAEIQRIIIVLAFQPIIKFIAGRYPQGSQHDLSQEGNIGLLNAIQKFPKKEDKNRFLGYAIKSIKNAMKDFERGNKLVPKLEAPSIDFQDAPTPCKVPMFVYTSTFSSSPTETRDYDNAPPAINYYSTTSLSVEILYQLDKETLKRLGFNEREIRIWDLHVEGYKDFEIAQQIHLSSSYTSKLLRQIKAQIQHLIK
jgi:RNA polymerase sigma factor (sigma-70 family)